MHTSVFDLFRIGIGPSSSHTVGPMRAAHMYAQTLLDSGLLQSTERVRVVLYGSLAATERGHATDTAVMLGLEGNLPEQIDPEQIQSALDHIHGSGQLNVLGQRPIKFDPDQDLVFLRKSLPFHPNALTFSAYSPERPETLLERTYYSVGGGFVVDGPVSGTEAPEQPHNNIPYPFDSAADLLTLCQNTGHSIAHLAMQNECATQSEAQIRQQLLNIWKVMQECVQRGCRHEGVLPGPLRVRRRAATLYRRLTSLSQVATDDTLNTVDWINLYALAVNEENAAGGRVVTAPTNGAAGIIPAVLHYYVNFVPGASERGVTDFLLTAGAIGSLYKRNGSISGAEVGCQGEVGVACSMAAGGLAAVMGGSPAQVEYAAEIGMEHNLGLTCDPVHGLVQVPCIERNAMGAVKALNAARMAMLSDGSHVVSLDQVIKTMMQTGADMKTKYKETARGGLAVNVIEC